MDIRARIEATKQYAKDHVPETVTAVASVVTAATLISLNGHVTRVHREEVRARKHNSHIVSMAIEQDRGFTYLPGLGVHIHKIETPGK